MATDLPKPTEHALAVAQEFCRRHELNSRTEFIFALTNFQSLLDVAETFFALGYDRGKVDGL